MGTQLRVLIESYPMNTNITGFRWFSKICLLVILAKVASALEGLRIHRSTEEGFIIGEKYHNAVAQFTSFVN